jgi:hypothetical protein
LKISHSPESRVTDGAEVSLTHEPHSTRQKYFYFYLWYPFLLVTEETSSPSAAGRIRIIDKIDIYSLKELYMKRKLILMSIS